MIEEYLNVIREYGVGYCESINLVDEKYLQIEWLEKSGVFHVFVGVNGWFYGDDVNDVYPTFESLALNKSKSFSIQWNNKLMEKLNDIK